MVIRSSARPQAGALAPPVEAQASGKSTDSVDQNPAYLPGDLVLSRDGRTQYQIQKDGSWKKLREQPSLEDAVRARARHAQDHARVDAHKLEKRSGLVTPAAATSTLILGEDVDREFKQLTKR